MSTNSLIATEQVGAAGAEAPRVSLFDLESKIASVIYFIAGHAVDALIVDEGENAEIHFGPGSRFPSDATAALDLLTICLVTMKNGFTVIGKSAPASAANFDKEKGRTFAYEDAVRQIWPLEGYALREKLGVLTALDPRAPVPADETHGDCA